MINIQKVIKSKKGIAVMLLILMSMVVGLSYSVFVISTSRYKASEMLVSNLVYGINIEPTNKGNTTVTNKRVRVLEGSTTTILVKITSLNPVESKYSLEYKVNEGVANVYYSYSTGWLPSGKINKSGKGVYEKTVKVVIEGVSESEVEFNVSGGYTYNSEVEEKEGYTKVTEEYDKGVLASKGEILEEIIEKETNGSGVFGGESKNNYLEYGRLWRILRVNEEGIKLISEKYESTTRGNIETSLNSIYTTLPDKSDYIENTNKFNCSLIGCIESSYNNVGLISTYEYELVGGLNSYLAPIEDYFSINNSNIMNITRGGIEETEETTSSGVRASIYLQRDVQVVGSGTISDPYKLSPKGDIIIASATLNGKAFPDKEEGYFPSESDPYIINNVTCTNNPSAYYDEERKEIRLPEANLPTSCNIDFTSGPTISISGENIEVLPVASTPVGRNGEKEFTVKPKTGYEITDIKCTNNVVPILSGTTLKITNIKETSTCNIEVGVTLYNKILADNPTVGTRSSFDSVFTSNTANTIYKVNGELTENAKDVYYFAGGETTSKKINNWVKFGKDKDGKNLYWRIIRTNEDRSVRLLYAGSSNTTSTSVPTMTNAYIEKSTYSINSSTYSNTMYVGYMYGTKDSLNSNRGLDSNGNYTGTLTDSGVKKTVDTWYGNGLNTKTDGTYKYDSYISKTAVYCNDRSGEGWRSSGQMYYASYNRVNNNNKAGKQPSYRCGYGSTTNYYTSSGQWSTKEIGMYSDARNADRFSASIESSNEVTGGNGKLQYPVALMTADEVSFAGGLYGTNNPTAWYYLNASANGSVTGGQYWWTMSPCHFNSNAFMFGVYGSTSIGGHMACNSVNASSAEDTSTGTSISFVARPVISLKSCIGWKTGNGTVATPYEVEISSTCASSVN